MTIAFWFFPIVMLFWIFILWMGWKIVQGLRMIDSSLKEIGRSLNQRQQ